MVLPGSTGREGSYVPKPGVDFSVGFRGRGNCQATKEIVFVKQGTFIYKCFDFIFFYLVFKRKFTLISLILKKKRKDHRIFLISSFQK